MKDTVYLEDLKSNVGGGVKFFLERPRDDNQLDLELIAEFSPKDDEKELVLCMTLQSTMMHYLSFIKNSEILSEYSLVKLDLSETEYVLGCLRCELVNELLLCESKSLRDFIDEVDRVISLRSPIVVSLS